MRKSWESEMKNNEMSVIMTIIKGNEIRQKKKEKLIRPISR